MTNKNSKIKNRLGKNLEKLFFNKDFVEKAKIELGAGRAITYQEFIEEYETGKILVFVNKPKAKYLLKSSLMKKSYKIIDTIGTIGSFVFTIIFPIALFFMTFWQYAIVSLIFGLLVAWASNHLSYHFILKNTFESEEFWNYALFLEGIEIKDKDGNIITSATLKEKVVKALNKKSLSGLSEYLKN